jgi:formylglycine-generating enzyme required for sulfatase activity
MPNRGAYERYLAASGFKIDDLGPIFDGEETTSLLAASLAVISGAKAPKGVEELVLPALQKINYTNLDLLEDLHSQAKTRYGLSGEVYVGCYPTPVFDGETVPAEGGALILVNNGALQLIGGAVQLLFSKYGFIRKAQELRRMALLYVDSLTIPPNSAFATPWADFEIEKYMLGASLATSAELFLILHEYGHFSLNLFDHNEDNEIDADSWALSVVGATHQTDTGGASVGPLVFLGLCYLIEKLSAERFPNDTISKTHPGAPLRLAQAAVEMCPLFSRTERALASDFLALVDAAITLRIDPDSKGYARTILEIASTLQTFFPIALFDMLKNEDRKSAFQALLNVVAEEVRQNPTNVKAGNEIDASLPPGLFPSTTDGVFLYELPTGDKLEMVFVPKGPFLFGPRLGPGFPGPDDFEGKGPANTASLDHDFYIGRFPVLRKQYAAFSDARHQNMPDDPSWHQGENYPIVSVSVADAEAFCLWAGLALPSEKQWEKAARGTDGRLLPSGAPCPANDAASPDASPREAVADPSTVSPFGVEHAVRNVFEITSDWLESDHPMGTGRYRVTRGTSYRADRTATVLSRHRVMPDFTFDSIGFRVILPLEAPTAIETQDWKSEVLGSLNAEMLQPTNASPAKAEQPAARKLFEACEGLDSECVDTVRQTLRQYPHAGRWLDNEGCTALLRVAAKLPYFEVPFLMASALVEAGVDLNAQTPEGATALHMLACRPQLYSLSIAELLLRNGARLDLRDRLGRTSEMVGRQYQHMMGDGFVALVAQYRNRDAQ